MFIKDSHSFMKQCYLIASTVKKIQKVTDKGRQDEKGRKTILLNCAYCDSKKSSFIKE